MTDLPDSDFSAVAAWLQGPHDLRELPDAFFDALDEPEHLAKALLATIPPGPEATTRAKELCDVHRAVYDEWVSSGLSPATIRLKAANGELSEASYEELCGSPVWDQSSDWTTHLIATD